MRGGPERYGATVSASSSTVMARPHSVGSMGGRAATKEVMASGGAKRGLDLLGMRASDLPRTGSKHVFGRRAGGAQPMVVPEQDSLLSPGAAAAQGAGQAQGLLGGANKPKKDETGMDATACVKLARQHKLEVHEVRYIWETFSRLARNPIGGFDREIFAYAMQKIFDVKSVDSAVQEAAYDISSAKKVEPDFPKFVERFLAWYVQNMFTAVANLAGSADMMAADNMVYELAKKHGCCIPILDKIKKKFDQVDVDKSGLISYNEFIAMLVSIMGVSNQSELNAKRVERFWKEIDLDGSGEVDFSEFAEWYLKYFRNSDSTEQIVKAFYDSYNPSTQRQASMQCTGGGDD